MKLYVVNTISLSYEGELTQEIYGVYTTLEKAIEAGKLAVKWSDIKLSCLPVDGPATGEASPKEDYILDKHENARFEKEVFVKTYGVEVDGEVLRRFKHRYEAEEFLVCCREASIVEV